ncbi:MAG: dihydropteroate synthase [Candidatus Eremiobacteraeota bacterium]|nr:dihydropteroate synthase [Candidatus Eremiobacteraeota bacterium]
MNATARGALRVRGKDFRWGARTYVMGIVNVTPDSFSGDGSVDVRESAARARLQCVHSSDLLDIGAESTRPGNVPIDESAETARLLPVIRAVRAEFPDVPISADTYKPSVFRAAHAAGADILNSVWGLPDELLEAALECGSPVIVMHNKSQASYAGDVVDEVVAYLGEAAQRGVRAGIAPERIVLDPGIGFGKTAEQNLAVLRSLRRVVGLGFPTLLGTSRKSTIGKLTGREPADRVFGTAATGALAVASGIDIVRVHDVDSMRDVVSVSDAIERGWRPAGWIE